MKDKWMLAITLVTLGIYIIDLVISYYRFFQTKLVSYPAYAVLLYRGVDYTIPFGVIIAYWLIRYIKNKEKD